jgi:hypothetical protein
MGFILPFKGLKEPCFFGKVPDGKIRMFHSDPARKLSANLYDIYHCCVYSEKTPDDGQRNCPKHVDFHSKNKFEKLVHIVGFIFKKFNTMCSHVNVKFDIKKFRFKQNVFRAQIIRPTSDHAVL